MSHESQHLPHAELTQKVIAAFFETASELGSGFSERVNQRSLQVVLIDKGLQPEIDVPIRVYFRDRRVGRFLADVIVNGTILVEVKAVAELEDYMTAQILNYLKCAGGGIGLLVNFGRSVQFKRFVVGDPLNSLPVLRGQGSAAGGRRQNEQTCHADKRHMKRKAFVCTTVCSSAARSAGR